MNKLKLTGLVIIITMLSSGCWTPKRIEKFKAMYCHGQTTIQNDTTVITNTVYEPVDTTLYLTIEGLIRANFECDSNNNVLLGKIDTLLMPNGMNISIVPHGNGAFDISCPIDSMAVYFRYFNTHKTTLTNIRYIKGEVVIVKERLPLTQWQGFRLIGFWVGWGLIVIFLLWRIIRQKFSFMDKIK